MKESHEHVGTEQEAGTHSAGIMIARLVWIAVGPMALLLVAFSMLSHRQVWITTADLFFAGIVVISIACRWLEYMSGTALTSTGEPARLDHIRRYTWVMLAVSAAAWFVLAMIGFSGWIRV